MSEFREETFPPSPYVVFNLTVLPLRLFFWHSYLGDPGGSKNSEFNVANSAQVHIP